MNKLIWEGHWWACRHHRRRCVVLLPLLFLRGGWFRHQMWLHPARRPHFKSNAQPQTNQ